MMRGCRQTFCVLWLQAECEVLDRKMAALKADMGEQAAEVHRSHKFNSGATEPTGESSPGKLASGLLATAEVTPLPRLAPVMSRLCACC